MPFAGGNIEEDEDLDFDNLVLTQAVQMPLHRPPRCASFPPSQFPKLVCATQGHQTRHGDASLRPPREEEEDDEDEDIKWNFVESPDVQKLAAQDMAAWIEAHQGTLLCA